LIVDLNLPPFSTELVMNPVTCLYDETTATRAGDRFPDPHQPQIFAPRLRKVSQSNAVNKQSSRTAIANIDHEGSTVIDLTIPLSCP